MPDDSKQNSQNQGEIDLLYVFIKLGEFVKRTFLNLLKFIGRTLVFLIRKWYYFAIALILAVLAAFILNKTAVPFYHSNLTIRSNATHNQPIMSNFDRLGEYAKSKNYLALAKELDISTEEASEIKSLETFWFYDIGDDGIFDGLDTEGKFLSDTSIVKIDSVFSIRAEVYEPGILNILESGLIFYIENNTFLKSLNKQRISSLNSRLDQIEYEIEKLDSLQKREYYTNPDALRQKEGQIIFTADKEVRIYHSQMFNLLNLKQECERDINLYSEVVTVLESFTIPAQPEKGTIQYLKKLIWYFMGLALLLSMIITFRKRIWTGQT